MGIIKYVGFIAIVLLNALAAKADLARGSRSNDTRVRPNQNSEFLRTESVVLAIIYIRDEIGHMTPKCTIDTIHRPELVPSFMQAAHEGTTSEFHQNPQLRSLPTCAQEDRFAIIELRDHMILEGSQIAFAQYIVACAAGLGLGAVTDSPFIGAGGGGVLGGALGGFSSSGLTFGSPLFSWRLSSAAAGLASGALAGVVCHAFANYSIQYLTQ